MRCEEKQVDAVELHAVYLGSGSEVEHRIEADGRLGIGAFADDSRSCVMKFRKIAAAGDIRNAP
jgi:hypothetical protein